MRTIKCGKKSCDGSYAYYDTICKVRDSRIEKEKNMVVLLFILRYFTSGFNNVRTAPSIKTLSNLIGKIERFY